MLQESVSACIADLYHVVMGFVGRPRLYFNIMAPDSYHLNIIYRYCMALHNRDTV